MFGFVSLKEKCLLIHREISFPATLVSGLAVFIQKSDIAEEKSATGALIAIAIATKPCSFNFRSSLTSC